MSVVVTRRHGVAGLRGLATCVAPKCAKPVLTAEERDQPSHMAPVGAPAADFPEPPKFKAAGAPAEATGAGAGGASVGAPALAEMIYLDYQATTPIDPRVVEAMLPCLRERYGNAHSRTHAFGWDAEKLVEAARAHVAGIIGASPKEVIFTSGATESNNLAIKGVAAFLRKQNPDRKHIITTQTEHKCVLAAAQYLQNECGYDVTYLPVQTNGLVDLEVLKKAIRPNETSLVSIMLVNNEIGVIQPIKDIAACIRAIDPKIVLHTDAAQAVGKMPVDVDDLDVDLMSMSAHKMYGPKGIGALYVRNKAPKGAGGSRRVRLVPQIHGGGQERGLRSGTLAVSQIVGMGKACEIAKAEMTEDLKRITELSQRFREKIVGSLPKVILNGDEHQRYPGNVNLSFDSVEGESLIMHLKDIAVSSGSACTSESLEPSYVLRAIGVDEDLAHTSLRFGIGKFSTQKELDYVADKVIEAVTHLRNLSPVWDFKYNKDVAEEGESLVWT